MTTALPDVAARALVMRPCSVVPGRQRWEVAGLRGRPDAARLVEESLRTEAGVDGATANPVTGRVLLLHDRSLTTPEASHLLRRAVVRSLARVLAPPPPAPARRPRAGRARMRSIWSATAGRLGLAATAVAGEDATGQGTPARENRLPVRSALPAPRASGPGGARLGSGSRSSSRPGSTRRWLRRAALAAGGTLLVVGTGGAVVGFLLRPLVSLGLVAGATTLIVRRAWRRAEQPGAAKPRRHMLRDLIGPHRKRFTLAALTSLLAQAAEMTLGLFIATIAVVLMQGESQFLAGLGIVGAGTQLWWLAAATALVCGAVAALSYTSGLAWRRLARDVEYDWRNHTYAHAQRLPLSALEGSRTSRVTGVLSDDIGRMGAFVAGTLPELVQMVTSVLVIVPVFLVFAPQIAWVAFLPVPLVTWLSFRFHDRDAGEYAAAGETRARLHSRMANTLQANSTVKASCTEDYEDARIVELGDQYRDTTARTDRGTVRHTESVRLATTASMAGTLLFGGRAVLAGELPFQAFSPLVGLPQQMLWRLTRLGATADQYRRTLDSYDRVAALVEMPEEPVRAVAAAPAGAKVDGELVFDRVSFAYTEGVPVLRDLSLRIAAGRVTGIVGPTGSGKTTIARLLMRFEEVDEGRILLDGRDVRAVPLHELRSTIGLVAQEPVLFDGTIADNVRYGSFDADDRRVLVGTRLAEAESFIVDLPEREQTIVGERGSALSGGQKQRVALARTILRNPPVVLLDEATSAVDNGTEAAIQRALKQFGAGRTMVVIAHRLTTVRDADWIYVLDRGGVLSEQGTHDELIGRGGVYADLWRLQAGEEQPGSASSAGPGPDRSGAAAEVAAVAKSEAGVRGSATGVSAVERASGGGSGAVAAAVAAADAVAARGRTARPIAPAAGRSRPAATPGGTAQERSLVTGPSQPASKAQAGDVTGGTEPNPRRSPADARGGKRGASTGGTGVPPQSATGSPVGDESARSGSAVSGSGGGGGGGGGRLGAVGLDMRGGRGAATSAAGVRAAAVLTAAAPAATAPGVAVSAEVAAGDGALAGEVGPTVAALGASESGVAAGAEVVVGGELAGGVGPAASSAVLGAVSSGVAAAAEVAVGGGELAGGVGPAASSAAFGAAAPGAAASAEVVVGGGEFAGGVGPAASSAALGAAAPGAAAAAEVAVGGGELAPDASAAAGLDVGLFAAPGPSASGGGVPAGAAGAAPAAASRPAEASMPVADGITERPGPVRESIRRSARDAAAGSRATSAGNRDLVTGPSFPLTKSPEPAAGEETRPGASHRGTPPGLDVQADARIAFGGSAHGAGTKAGATSGVRVTAGRGPSSGPARAEASGGGELPVAGREASAKSAGSAGDPLPASDQAASSAPHQPRDDGRSPSSDADRGAAPPESGSADGSAEDSSPAPGSSGRRATAARDGRSRGGSSHGRGRGTPGVQPGG
nr:ABC transporter ATP-binding protein [Streptomyces sp.]